MPSLPKHPIAIVGAGPAGLMAAECLSRAGVAVDVYDAMPSAGRKFLLAGKGGLNLTHAEPLPDFIARYGAQAGRVASWLDDLGPQALRDWAAGLGVQTFVGSSGRVFPTEMKAAPLLRAWLRRLRQPSAAGARPVRFHMRHRCTGWQAAGVPNAAQKIAPDGAGTPASGLLSFETPAGPVQVPAPLALLALGGGSWPRLGSDGAWVSWLGAAGAAITPLAPANCGFDAAGRDGHGWTPLLATRFAGAPLKNVALCCVDAEGRAIERRGEFVLTATGVEGSLIYSVAQPLRQQIEREGQARFSLNMLPARTPEQVAAALALPRGRRSLSAHLKARLGLGGVQTALLYELLTPEQRADMGELARAIQALPIVLRAPRPLAEAISSAGGVRLDALDDDLQMLAIPGLFCAGEMLDWEAPTGGYLLTASMASGVRAARGMLRRLGLDRAG